MKIFKTRIQWVDENNTDDHWVLITDTNDSILPEPYTDEDIFFHGLSGDELNEMIETRDESQDFIVKEFYIEWEGEIK